jgi:hypothetical protein
MKVVIAYALLVIGVPQLIGMSIGGVATIRFRQTYRTDAGSRQQNLLLHMCGRLC